MKRLIVTADDLGLHPGMNVGAVRAHRQGIVTACSLVANGRAFDHAVELLKENPRLEVGVHFTFVEEKPLNPSLGSFARNWRGFALRYFAGAVDFGELERELRLQVEKVLRAGLPVTHLNSHQHLHALPRVSAMVVRIAAEYRIGYVRVPLDRGGETRKMAMRVLAHFARRLPGKSNTIGIAEAGHLTAPRLVRLLEHVETATELVTHPGIGDHEIAATYDWGYSWDAETSALCDPAVKETIRARGITLTTPSQAS